MYKKLIWRDDDIHWSTDLAQFIRVHELFNKYDAVHTIAVIAKDIDKNQELVEYIKSQPNIDIQLHCWEHISFTHNLDILKEDLKQGIKKLEDVFGKKPTILYPPWNNTNDKVERIANLLGLKVSNIKVGISFYLKAVGKVDEETVNFHNWSVGDCIFLEQALQLNLTMKTRCTE
jgi:peptidoglycan/xylan/chitin deacetylase (PgdA/CDA1 family)